MIEEHILDQAVADLFSGISFPQEPSGLYDPLRYMIAIGGKRLRPKLCLLTYSLFRDTLDETSQFTSTVMKECRCEFACESFLWHGGNDTSRMSGRKTGTKPEEVAVATE